MHPRRNKSHLAVRKRREISSNGGKEWVLEWLRKNGSNKKKQKKDGQKNSFHERPLQFLRNSKNIKKRGTMAPYILYMYEKWPKDATFYFLSAILFHFSKFFYSHWIARHNFFKFSLKRKTRWTFAPRTPNNLAKVGNLRKVTVPAAFSVVWVAYQLYVKAIFHNLYWMSWESNFIFTVKLFSCMPIPK